MHDVCMSYRHEFVMPEHFLAALLQQNEFNISLIHWGVDLNLIYGKLKEWFRKQEKVPEEAGDYIPATSLQLQQALESAVRTVQYSSAKYIYVPHIVKGIIELEDSEAAFLLNSLLGDYMSDFQSELVMRYQDDHDQVATADDEADDDEDIFASSPEEPWRKLVVCLNDTYQLHNPLIGRHAELERTIQTLCRKEKNNPLHVGEPGVGKTALVYGLAERIEKGKVPARLKGSKMYMLDLGTLLAGTQFRGDFEKRIKEVMDGISAEAGNNIVYIDEIHNLVGTGNTGDSSLDASNMLK